MVVWFFNFFLALMILDHCLYKVSDYLVVEEIYELLVFWSSTICLGAP